MRKFLPFLILFFLCAPLAFADTATTTGAVIADKTEIVKARVLEVVSQSEEQIPGTGVSGLDQTIKAEILQGSEEGKTVTFDNDYVKLAQGDLFYLVHNTRGEDGVESYSVSDPYRLPAIYFFGGLFVFLVLLIGGWQGLRGLISLAGSLLLILYVLLPAILAGYSPVLVTVGVSSLIIIVGSYVTHGFNKTTSAAVAGMIVTVIVTGLLADFAVHFAKLTGYSSEEVSYLVFNSRGTIDILGVLLGGIMIGVLGILYDVAIGQAVAVEELHKIAPHMPKSHIYFRALRIGREHIGALVNTLAIAYVGAALPLLLLYTQFGTSLTEIANREIFTTEIIRTLVGSIGLVLAVPVTTLFAVAILVKTGHTKNALTLQEESEALKHFEHHH